MSIWLVLIAAGLITYAIRLSFILLFGKLDISPRLRRALRFVPPAVLSAIIFPELLFREGALDFSLGNARLLAGLVAALVAWRTRSVLLTIFIGMLVLLALQSLLS